jgi:Flp pilus assembly protein TadG
MRKHIMGFFRNLWRDTSGVMLPYVTIMLPVIIGLGLLTVDGARFQSLQTQMQAAADAAALAGAAELNGKSGARSRATAAIDNYLSNHLSGMGIAAAVQHSTPTYYSALPPANQLPSNGTVATSDADAHFVLVMVTPVTFPALFPRPVIDSVHPYSFHFTTTSLSSSAQAVAGMDESICDVPPVYICNPWEGSGVSLSTALATPLQKRTEIKLLMDNSNNDSPGHFGFLVPPDGDVGASNLQEWISTTTPKACYKTSSVDLNTGNKQSALGGFNARLDIGADSSHAPDVNVRKGYVASSSGNWCAPQAKLDPNALGYPSSSPEIKYKDGFHDSTQSMAFPQDSCFSAGTCPQPYMGDGQWDCGSYWDFNHHTAAAAPSGCSTPAATTISRYDVYQYEIANNLVGDWSRGTGGTGTNANNWAPGGSPWSKKGEQGAPMCATGQGVPNRRVLAVAVIDCIANKAAMANGGQTANDVPVNAFAKFFLTRPVVTTGSSPDNGKIIGEFTGVVTNSDAKIYQNVKLYR